MLGITKKPRKKRAPKPLYTPTSSHHPERKSEDEHSHTCDLCKTKWFHGPENMGSVEAHNCPKPGCTGHQRWRDVR